MNESMKPKVSIVVPIYNVEQFLDRTMQSLIAQTLKNIEIIMVDDESPDNCPAICDRYAEQYPNIKVVHKKNAGLGMACNSGIEVASGEYIAFCDSDDYVDKDMYETMYCAAIEHNADAIYSGIQTVNQFGEVKPMNGYSSKQIIEGKENLNSFVMDMIASKPSDRVERHIPMSAKIVLYRKSLIDDYRLKFVSEREIISEDLVWNIDFISHSHRIVTLPQIFYYYYNNTSSLSKKVRVDRFEFFKIMRLFLITKVNEYKMSYEALHRIERMFIGYSRYFIGSILKSDLASCDKKQIVKNVCEDEVWKLVCSNYPIREMPYTHRIMLYLMRNNCFVLLSLIYKYSRKFV